MIVQSTTPTKPLSFYTLFFYDKKIYYSHKFTELKEENSS